LEFIVTILCAMSGALIGTTVGIRLMFRRFRLPSQAELDTLRGNLETVESSLAAATTVSENLRKQVAERDRSIQESSQQLNEKQRQLGFAIAEAEKAAAERAAAEQKAAALTERRAELEAQLEEERTRVAEQAGRQLASYEAQLDAGKLQIQEVGGEVARLTVECADLKAQLGTERERSGQLAGQIAELQSDRQSAAKGIELLLMAQQNLSRFLQPVCEGGPNGNGGAVPVEAATAVGTPSS
jgi:chromosome segregation ATPase